MSIAENVAQVRAKIEAAEKRAGREAGSVDLICVCKFVDTERIQKAIDCGLRHVGENRAQELTEKLNFYKQNDCTIHFIGQLQTNKIKYICGNADLIQSVDRIELALAIEAFCKRHSIHQDILIEVNIGKEPQKGGVMADKLDGLLSCLESSDSLTVKGLMCVPPAAEGEQVRPYFRAMYELKRAMQDAHPSMPLKILSMGMSHDYEIAVEEGATMVRVGTAIFGDRKILSC